MALVGGKMALAGGEMAPAKGKIESAGGKMSRLAVLMALAGGKMAPAGDDMVPVAPPPPPRRARRRWSQRTRPAAWCAAQPQPLRAANSRTTVKGGERQSKAVKGSERQ